MAGHKMHLLKRFILKKFYDIFKLISENVIDQNPAQGPTLAQPSCPLVSSVNPTACPGVYVNSHSDEHGPPLVGGPRAGVCLFACIGQPEEQKVQGKLMPPDY